MYPFTLEDGKVYGLLGRNGAGKTSLLSILASFREPSDGMLLINGETPFENAADYAASSLYLSERLQRRIRYVKTMFNNMKKYRPYFDIEFANQLAGRFKLP